MFLAHTVALQKASKGHSQVEMGLTEGPGMSPIYSSPLSVRGVGGSRPAMNHGP